AVLYRESLSHYERIGNHLSMARHHGDLGQIAIQLNDFKTANEEYAKSIWLSYRMGYRLWIVEGLEGLAQVGVGARRWKRATRLIGAAQMLREEIGAVRVPMKRAALEKCRFEAHEALGDAFDAHWQNGRDRMAWLMLRMQKAKR
ncbi:MAG TPA: hypothetical protein VKU00_28340, partial [Chthonomonadaceae bacterium]|nr:hypothetical protein [Chthonomonadaceae bacterium]